MKIEFSLKMLIHYILLLNLLMAIKQMNVMANQKFAIEPESQSGLLGSQIILPCRVVDLKGVLQWTKDDFGLGTHRNLTAFDRYTMTGTDEDGDYSLQIDALELDDDGKYQCQVSPGSNGEPGIRSRYASITVLIPPDNPKITQGDFKLATEDSELQLECISNGGKPAAELTWIDGSGNVLTKGIKYVKELLPDGKRFKAKSILKMKPKKEHHNTTFTCQAQNSADRNFKTVELKMEVRYAPKIHLSIIKTESNTNKVHHKNNNNNIKKNDESDENDGYDDEDNEDDEEDSDDADENNNTDYDENDENSSNNDNNNNNMAIREGTEVKFLCTSNANPPEVTYKWYINNEFVIGDYTNEMLIHNVSRSQHMAEIKCEVTNEVGTSEDSLELNVMYPPIFKEKPSSVEAEIGEKVTLNCDADGNPVEIVWVHDPTDRLNFHPRVVGSTNEIKIKASNETAGRYFCKAIVIGYAEIKTEAYIYLKQSPIIYSPAKQYGSEGDTLRLECSAFSVPKARHISWSFMGREINTNTDHDYSILEDPAHSRGIKSTLVIRDSQSWHFGKYNCSVVNDYGTDVLEIELQHQNNFQYLMIIVGATSGVVIFVIIIVLFLCCKLKGKQHDQDDENENDINEKHYDKEKNFPADIIPDKHKISADKCWKESDCSSHSSDYKPDIKASGSSESDYSVGSSTTNFIDSTYDIKNIRREQSLPLAGTVNQPNNNYRYSFDEDQSSRIPKYAHNNYGYIDNTNIDNSRYYSPPTQSQYQTANKVYLVQQPPQPQPPQQQQQQQSQSQQSYNSNNNHNPTNHIIQQQHHPSIIDNNNYSFIDNLQYSSIPASLRHHNKVPSVVHHDLADELHRTTSMLV